MVQIDHNVALPEERIRYPFRDMEPGDSILFKDKRQGDSARVAALRFVRMYRPEWGFSMRKVDNGWRLWRTN